jgi:phenylalanyl-tRNA synthetase beta chain
VVVSEEITIEEIINECRSAIKDVLVNITIFDIYRGENIGVGKKSLAINLVLQSKDRTLEEQSISSTISQCITTLEEKFDAVLRK